MQSVKVEQGPLERWLRLASAHVHTVHGPVSARVGALDARDAQRLWSETAHRAVEAAAADTSHRWREREARRGPATSGTSATTPSGDAFPGSRTAPPGWGDVPTPEPHGEGGRLGVGVVGAGKVGPVLGAALANAEHAVVGVTAVSDAGRDRAEAMLPGAPVLATPDLVERSELVLLAVPDDQLAELVRGLADAGIWQPGQLVVHTSPDHGVGVLAHRRSRPARSRSRSTRRWRSRARAST